MGAKTTRMMLAREDWLRRRKSLVESITQGTAAAGLVYVRPMKPKRYTRPLNADLVAIGGDMRRAMEAHDHGQDAKQAQAATTR